MSKDWIGRIQALADAHPNAPVELAGGLAVALRRVTVGGIGIIGMPNAADYELVRSPDETDEEFAEAKRTYAALFDRLRQP
jgi:hypothetical protein